MLHTYKLKKVPEVIFVGGRHGNDRIHMCTKFHLASLRSEEVILKKIA